MRQMQKRLKSVQKRRVTIPLKRGGIRIRQIGRIGRISCASGAAHYATQPAVPLKRGTFRTDYDGYLMEETKVTIPLKRGTFRTRTGQGYSRSRGVTIPLKRGGGERDLPLRWGRLRRLGKLAYAR